MQQSHISVSMAAMRSCSADQLHAKLRLSHKQTKAASARPCH